MGWGGFQIRIVHVVLSSLKAVSSRGPKSFGDTQKHIDLGLWKSLVCLPGYRCILVQQASMLACIIPDTASGHSYVSSNVELCASGSLL